MFNRRWQAFLVAVPVTAMGFLASAPGAQADSSAGAHGSKRVCAATSGAVAACDARVVVDGKGSPLTFATPSGYGPSDLGSAYALGPVASGSWVWNGQTVAIVDAYRNLNAAGDLATYRSQYGLPPCAAGTCFREVNQNGAASPLPAGNQSWGQEIDLDLDMVSAVCPMCQILLVDGNSASLTDLGTAVNSAAALGANAISNSYGTNGEVSGEANLANTYYNHAGVAITASSGDGGYGVEFPAVAPDVTAVGGTSLKRASNARGWTETAWSGAGSGCSTQIAQQSWQSPAVPASACSKRSVADVSAIADPNTGVAVYDSYHGRRGASWMVFGGTSVASPIIAATYARANAAGNTHPTYGELPYAHTASLNDVTSGSNGSCGGSLLCTAGAGYDGPTGLGTPNGLGAF